VPAAGAYPGYQFEPTVLVDVDPGAPAAREEIFGPALVAYRWSSEDEVLRAANDSS
jgi:acyl-CoA reductase-like NAD-dependent aldehyde dehydrogenase